MRGRYHPKISSKGSWALVVVLAIGLPTVCAAQDNKNMLGVELLGRAVIYSVNYERQLSPRTGFGGGVAHWTSNQDKIEVVPIYASLNALGDRHSLYVAAGSTLCFGTLGSRDFWGFYNRDRAGPFFSAYGVTAFGYEYRSAGGWVIRPTANLLFNRSEAHWWPGLIVGHRF